MKKITIIGNSVTLRVRPPENNNNHVYGTILENQLNLNGNWIVKNMGLGRWVSNEYFINTDIYIRTFPNYFILNIGCVDAPNREVPFWFAKLILKRNKSKLYYLTNIIYSKFINKEKNRRKLTLIRKKSWVSKTKFKTNMIRMVKHLTKETNAKIIIIGINKGNERIEKSLPGTIKKYSEYNDILKNICLNQNINFLKVDDLNTFEHFPDGVHYNKLGHEMIANRILSIIKDKC